MSLDRCAAATLVGLVRDATRLGQAASLTMLRDFDPARADMHASSWSAHPAPECSQALWVTPTPLAQCGTRS